LVPVGWGKKENYEMSSRSEEKKKKKKDGRGDGATNE
jgi:hypothetical protein